MASSIIVANRKRVRVPPEGDNKVVAQLTSDSTKAHTFISGVVDRIFCLICAAIIQAVPVFQCENDHFVCPNCHSRLSACPFCRGRWRGRNRLAEDLISILAPLVELPCPNAFLGCTFEALKHSLDQHISECEHREVRCPLDDSNGCPHWTGSLSAFFNHIDVQKCCFIINVESITPIRFSFIFDPHPWGKPFSTNDNGDLIRIFAFRSPFLDRMVPVLFVRHLKGGSGGLIAYMRLMTSSPHTPRYEITAKLRYSFSEPEVSLVYQGVPHSGKVKTSDITKDCRYFYLSTPQTNAVKKYGSIRMTFHTPGALFSSPMFTIDDVEFSASTSESESDSEVESIPLPDNQSPPPALL